MSRCTQLIYPSTEGYLGCFQVLAIMNKAAVHICVQIFVNGGLIYTPRDSLALNLDCWFSSIIAFPQPSFPHILLCLCLIHHHLLTAFSLSLILSSVSLVFTYQSWMLGSYSDLLSISLFSLFVINLHKPMHSVFVRAGLFLSRSYPGSPCAPCLKYGVGFTDSPYRSFFSSLHSRPAKVQLSFRAFPLVLNQQMPLNRSKFFECRTYLLEVLSSPGFRYSNSLFHLFYSQ